MKRAIVASILGIAGSVACSYGAGSFYFSTYQVAATSQYGVVRWSTDPGLAPSGLGGLPVIGGSNVVADLVYSFTGLSGLVTIDTGLAIPLSVVNGQDGYINDETPVELPDSYPNISGAGPAITMTINLSGTYQGAPVVATSTWVETGGFTVAPGQEFACFPGSFGPVLIMGPGPEPGIMALLGLGAASLLIFRKRGAAHST